MRTRKILSLALALVMVLVLMPITTAAATSGGQKTGEVAVKYFLQEATASTFGFDNEWCGMFIYRCAEEAGESAAMGGSMSNMAYVYTAANWFAVNAAQFGVFSDATVNDIRDHGGYNVNSSHRMDITDYKPQIGDVVFYDWSSGGIDIDHVEIVTDYGDGHLYSIGGNRGSGHWSTTKVDGQLTYLNTTNKACAITAFARPKYSNGDTVTPAPTPSTPPISSPTKTQYRYHRYEDNNGEYAVCAYWGNVTYHTTMHIAYTDWMDAPLPEVKQGYVNYLEHPKQGASCTNAGCLASDPFEVHRHVDANNKVWYYEETRTVAATQPEKPSTPMETIPNCANGHTFGKWEMVKESSCGMEGQRERVCDLCGEKETETLPALEHNYKIDGETDEAVYHVCTNCGDGYTEEKELPVKDKGDIMNFSAKSRYSNGLFDDVRSTDWFSEDVKTTYELGLMKGTGSGTFSPGNNVTLAETITLAARIHSIYYTGLDSFASYDGGNWYDPYVDYARENNIINTYYNYSRPATREEFIHILAKALPEEALENITGRISFADSGDITYMAEVRLLSGAGVINGIKENDKLYFKPLNTITRAEVAAVVARMAKPSQRVNG